MNIHIWSDYVCPFCYIGKRNLEEALVRAGLEKSVNVIFHSYQLNPFAKKEPTESLAEQLAHKYGMSIKEAQQNMANVTAQGKQVGLTFNFDKNIPTNTGDAHRVGLYACQLGKGMEWADAVFKAHFTDGAHIGRIDTLVELAASIGLDEKAVHEILNNEDFNRKVEDDQQLANQLGIKGVPFFVFDDHYAMSGAQPVETIEGLLKKITTSHNEEIKLQNGVICEDDTCHL